MILAAIFVAAAALAILLWHMQRPRPPKISVSFARFVPALPPAPAGRSRLSLTRPRDLPTLLALLLAAGFAIWALVDAQRGYLASRTGHLGLRVILDRSHSMSIRDAGQSRADQAAARASAALALLQGQDAASVCAELVPVGKDILPARPIAMGQALSSEVTVPLPEGAEPGRLLAAVQLPEGTCPLTHILVISDQPDPGAGAPEGLRLIWDQVGAPRDNHGLRRLALRPGAFGQSQHELILEGLSTGSTAPERVRLEGPGGAWDIPVFTDPDSEGRWSATAAYSGPGRYRVDLPQGDGYAGDNTLIATIAQPAGIEVDWQLSTVPRPAVLRAGTSPAPLVAPFAATDDAQRRRPVLLTYDGFTAAAPVRRIGPFLEDPVLLTALNFDALEAHLPAPVPGPLPAGFVPVLTDDQGGVILARRAAPFGLLLPAPRPDLPEPQRSLSLTLFFSALADLLALPAAEVPATWQDDTGTIIGNAWRESLTAVARGAPADLSALTYAGAARSETPVWPWAVLAALACLLAERLIRLIRKGERIL